MITINKLERFLQKQKAGCPHFWESQRGEKGIDLSSGKIMEEEIHHCRICQMEKVVWQGGR